MGLERVEHDCVDKLILLSIYNASFLFVMDFDLKSMFYDTSLTFLFFYYLHGISFSVDISIAIECIISVVIKSIINSHIH